MLIASRSKSFTLKSFAGFVPGDVLDLLTPGCVVPTIILPSWTISLSYVAVSCLGTRLCWSPFEALRAKNALRGDGVGTINYTTRTSFLTL
jgi:hypothetical protein